MGLGEVLTPPRDASVSAPPPVRHLSRYLSGRLTGSGAVMAAEEAEVDIEGDVVAAAAAATLSG